MRKFYFLTVIIVLLLATTIGIKAQSTCAINVGVVDPAYQEQVVSVPITVFNFKNVGGFQFAASFATTQMELIEEPSVTLNGVSVLSTNLAKVNQNGTLIVQWNYTGSPGGELTLADGSTLMTLKFYVKSSAGTGTSNITISNAKVINKDATSLLMGATNGSVKIASALTPTVKMQVKTGNSNVLQLYCQNFINFAGFEVTVKYPVATYPGVSTGGISFPNTAISGVTTSIKAGSPNQVFMAWAYSGYSTDAVTLGSDGSGVLAEIDFGTAINLNDLSLGSRIANSISNQEKTLSLTQDTLTATIGLGTVPNAIKGSVVSVPVNVKNFNNVGAFQLTVNFTTSQLELVEAPSATLGGVDVYSRSLSQVNADGNLILQWNYTGVAGQELNFGDGVLMNLKFLVKGAAATTSGISISTGKVINPNANSILKSGYPSGGAVIIQYADTTTFTLGTGTVGADNKVTIPLTAKSLNSLVGMELHITVPANFTITGTDITAASGWTYGAFTTGVVGTDARILWVYDGNMSHLATMADGATVANLVFTYTGPSTTANIALTIASAVTNVVPNTEVTAKKAAGTISLVEAVTVKAKVFLQGPFSSGTMSTALATGTLIPLAQPFTAAPFSYAGSEAVASTSVFTTNSIVDWVLVELRSTATGAAVTNGRKAALLKNDGTIVSVDGTTAGVTFASVLPANYFIVIKHRNHLAIMSAAAVALSNATAYDFTTAQAQAYGTNSMAALTGGVFGLYAGDSNEDGQVTALDFNTWNSNTKAGQTGYVLDDMNADGQVTALDFNLWNANTKAGAATNVP